MAKANSKSSRDGRRPIILNKRARHDFLIEDTIEAGIVLVGSEVKSLRAGKISLTDAYAAIENQEVFLISCHIAEYPQANRFNHEPRRTRKLLLHAHEIQKLATRIRERGYTLIPLSLYFKQAKVKVELGLGRGQKRYDKREQLRRKDQEREVSRTLASRRER